MGNLKGPPYKSICSILVALIALTGCIGESPIEAKLRGSHKHSGVFESGAPSDLNGILWKFRPSTKSKIRGSIVAGDGKAYVAGFDDGTLYAIDIQTGEETWNWGGDGEIGDPEYHNGFVYFGTQNGNFYAVDSANGKEFWMYKGVKYMSSAPTINERTVYISDAEGMRAIDIKTGQLKWSFIEDGFSAGGTVEGNTLYFSTKDHLFAVNKYTGKELWRNKIHYGKFGQPEAPTLSGDYIYTNSLSGIYRINKKTGQTIWFKEIPGLVYTAIAASNGKLFFGVWGDDTDRGYHSGYIKSIKMDDGTILWEAPLTKGTNSNPSLSGNNIYIGDWSGTLFAFNSNTGQALWNFKGAGSITGAPAIYDGSIIIGGDDGVFRLH